MLTHRFSFVFPKYCSYSGILHDSTKVNVKHFFLTSCNTNPWSETELKYFIFLRDSIRGGKRSSQKRQTPSRVNDSYCEESSWFSRDSLAIKVSVLVRSSMCIAFHQNLSPRFLFISISSTTCCLVCVFLMCFYVRTHLIRRITSFWLHMWKQLQTFVCASNTPTSLFDYSPPS